MVAHAVGSVFVVAQWLAYLPLVLEVPGSIHAGPKEIVCPNALSLVAFVGMILNKCMCCPSDLEAPWPCAGKVTYPLCRLKIWLLVGFHPATQSVQIASLPIMS